MKKGRFVLSILFILASIISVSFVFAQEESEDIGEFNFTGRVEREFPNNFTEGEEFLENIYQSESGEFRD